MILRLLLAVIGLVALSVAGLSTYVRLAPLAPTRWHLELAGSDPPAEGKCSADITVLVNGARAACNLPGTPAEVLTKLGTVAAASPRTITLAGSAEAGRITWTARSKRMGYPDVITAQVIATANGTRLAVFARQVYGNGDWGVNAARLKDWLSTF